MSHPEGAGGTPPRPRRGLAFGLAIAVGLVVGLAAGLAGGYALVGDRTEQGVDPHVRGTCEALAAFADGGFSWADESWTDDWVVSFHLWSAVIAYAQEASHVDPAFDVSDGSGPQNEPGEAQLDTEPLAAQERELTAVCAARSL